MNLNNFDATKLTYNDIIDGIDLKPPKWAHEVYTGNEYHEGGEPISAIDFYQDIFRDGFLEPHREREDYRTGEYGGIVLKARKTTAQERRKLNRNSIAERYTFTDGCAELIDIIRDAGTDFVFLSPASYAGKRRLNKNARFLYAIVFEIDNIKEAKNGKANGIEQLFYSFTLPADTRGVPCPTYIVCSGTGLHLYYVLQKPIPLFDNVLTSINNWRREIIPRAWAGVSKDAHKDVQYEHALQGFRAVGARTKGSTFAMAFKTGDYWAIEDLNEYVHAKNKINLIYQSNTRLSEAKELYPDWYERRIVKGQKHGHYKRDKGIYENWIKKIYDQASVGHRYYCLLELVALATQCDIPFERLETDAQLLTRFLDTKTIDAVNNPFTDYDMECALSMYGDEESYNRRVEFVEQATNIKCPKAKRNGRTQAEHIRIMNFVRDDINGNKDWRNTGGAKPKWEIVQDWKSKHPNGKKADCQRDTGLSKTTIIRWWDTKENPDKNYEEAKQKVQEWLELNPSGSKQQCHAETKVGMGYINKFWPSNIREKIEDYCEQKHYERAAETLIQASRKTGFDKILSDNELLK